MLFLHWDRFVPVLQTLLSVLLLNLRRPTRPASLSVLCLYWTTLCCVDLPSLVWDDSDSVYRPNRNGLVLTAMVWYSDLLCCFLNSVLIFIRSTSQRETMILVNTFSFAPLLCRERERTDANTEDELRQDSVRLVVCGEEDFIITDGNHGRNYEDCTFMASLSLLAKYSCLFSKHSTVKRGQTDVWFTCPHILKDSSTIVLFIQLQNSWRPLQYFSQEQSLRTSLRFVVIHLFDCEFLAPAPKNKFTELSGYFKAQNPIKPVIGTDLKSACSSDKSTSKNWQLKHSGYGRWEVCKVFIYLNTREERELKTQ